MFHVPTLIAVLAVSQVLMAGVLLFVWRLNRQAPAAGFWFYGVLFVLIGSLLLLPRQLLPPWATVVLANVMLLSGYVIHLCGIRRYIGRPALPWGVILALPATFAAAYGYFTYIDPDFSTRVFLYGMFGGVVTFASAREGLRSGAGRNMATVFYGCLSAFHGLFLLGRGVFSGLLHLETTFQNGATFLTQLVFIEGVVVTILTSVSFILLTTEHLASNLRKLSERDPLTNVFNRRVFFDLVEKSMSHARRKERPVALLALDLDHFKNINDTYGHAVGDDVLRAFTTMVEDVLRKEDVIGRLGGEEFCVLLPEAGLDSATDIANRICLACEALVVQADGRDVQFTTSIGVASLMGEEDGRSWLKRADTALYSAKETGRNRASIAV